jgi:hypothetical protein
MTLFNNELILQTYDKGKAVPQHTYLGAGGERMCSSYSFTTSELDGMSGQRHAPAAFYPQEKDTGTVVQESGRAPELKKL